MLGDDARSVTREMGKGGRASRAVLQKKAFPTRVETKVHGDALCFMVKTWARHKTTETVLAAGGGWWRLSVGGSWRLAVGGSWRLAVGGWWRLVAVGGWRLAVPGGCPEALS